MSSVPKISFTGCEPKTYPSGERHRKRPILNRISSMTDDEIISASVRNADKKIKESSAARVLVKGPLMFLAATTIVYGALKKGKLSDKAFETVKTAGIAGLVFGLSKPVNKIVDNVFSSDKNNDKDNKILPFVNAAALIGTSLLALKGIKKGSNKLAEIFEPTAKSIKDVFSKGANWLNSTGIGKLSDRISERAINFENMHPVFSNTLKISAIFAPLIATGVVTQTAFNKLEEQRAGITASNINKLVLCREFAQTGLKCCEANKTDKKQDENN